MAAMNFWGADQDANGDQQYSLYIEPGHSFTYKDVNIDLFASFTPIDPDEDKGESGFYRDTAVFVNLGYSIKGSSNYRKVFTSSFSFCYC